MMDQDTAEHHSLVKEIGNTLLVSVFRYVHDFKISYTICTSIPIMGVFVSDFLISFFVIPCIAGAGTGL